MKNLISVQNKFFLILLISIISILIIFSGFFYYYYERDKISTEKYNELKAISQLKTNQIIQWRNERLSEAHFFSENLIFINYTQQLLNNKKNNSINNYFNQTLSHIKKTHNYENIFITSQDGEILFSLDTNFKQYDPTIKINIKKAITQKKIIFSNFYKCKIHKKIQLDIIAPIINKKNTAIAVLILHINPEDYLYPLIQTWPTPSKTSETYIIQEEDKHVLFLNELRHRKHTALSLRFPLSRKELLSVEAILGHRGIWEGKDYREEKVLADIHEVPDTLWYMVAKVDKKEIFSELYYRATVIILVDFILIVMFGFGLALIYNYRQRNIYIELFLKEKDLRKKEKEFQAIFYSIGDAVIITDTSGKIKQMNLVAEKLTGWKEIEAKEKFIDKVFIIIDEDSRNKIKDQINRTLSEGIIRGFVNHTLLISKDGNEIPITESSALIKNEKNINTGIVFIFRDQTEKHNADRKLKESEKRFRSTFEVANIGITLTTCDGELKNINNAFCKMLGYTQKELSGKNFTGITHPDDIEKSKECVNSLISNKKKSFRIEKRYIKKNGNTLWADVSTILLRDSKKIPQYFITHIIDITKRKKNEALLRKSEERFKRALENIPDVIVIYDSHLRIQYINDATYGITNRPISDFIGKHEEEIWPPEVYQVYLPTLKEALNTRSIRSLETELSLPDDGVHNLIITCIPLIDEEGNVLEILGITHDYTDRKRKEEEIKKLNKELAERVYQRTQELEEKNKELEAFSYSVSHDLRAPLRAINGFSKILIEDYKENLDNEGKRLLDIIRNNAHKMDQLIIDLLALSRVSRSKIRSDKIDMKAVAKSIYYEVASVEIQKKFTFSITSLPNAFGDSTLIKQVWNNLISNAIKYTMKSKLKKIEINGYAEKEYNIFYIKDTGVGFDSNYIHRLFGVFQRLHRAEDFEGTGVGLAIVKRIIERHGGKVWAESKINHGATFYFSIPQKKILKI